MWVIQHIEFRPVELDFRSSGQGQHSSTGVFADGTQIINALDLVKFSADPVQLMVCGHCGVTACAPGNWVSPRRLGDGLLLIPCFQTMLGKRGQDFEPPDYLGARGPAFVAGPLLELLASRVSALGDLDRWPALGSDEFVRLMQWQGPAQVLGIFPDAPRLRRELVIAVDSGKQEEMIAVLEELLTAAVEKPVPVTPAKGELVTFYLDQPGICEWTPLAFAGSAPLLASGPDLIVSLASKA